MCNKENIFLSLIFIYHKNRTPYFWNSAFWPFQQGCQRAAKYSFCFVAALTNLQCLEGKKLGISKSDSLLFTYLVTGTNIHPYLESKRLSIVVLMDKIYYSFVKTLYVVKTHLVR